MKKKVLLFFALVGLTVGLTQSASAQSRAKKETIETKVTKAPLAAVSALKKPANVKNAAAPAKSRGDYYGPNYSDIVINNNTAYYLDIYVDGTYKMTVSPGYRAVTWAYKGTTKIYAKAVFNDGSYYYWGPISPVTDYEYTWNLY